MQLVVSRVSHRQLDLLHHGPVDAVEGRASTLRLSVVTVEGAAVWVDVVQEPGARHKRVRRYLLTAGRDGRTPAPRGRRRRYAPGRLRGVRAVLVPGEQRVYAERALALGDLGVHVEGLGLELVQVVENSLLVQVVRHGVELARASASCGPQAL